MTFVEPSLTGASWTEEDARLFDIIVHQGTNSPDGQELVAQLKSQYGDGWVAEWGRMQDYLNQKYLAATSDQSRLTTLQTTTREDAARMDPTGQYLDQRGGQTIPYSIHDINAFRAMSPQQQADFITGFSDPGAASYFMMVAGGASEDALAQIPPEYGGNKGVYIGPDGKDYGNYDDWKAAWDASGQQLPGQVVSVTTATGEVITDPDRLSNLSNEEVFGPRDTYTPPPTFVAPEGPYVPGPVTPGLVIPVESPVTAFPEDEGGIPGAGGAVPFGPVPGGSVSIAPGMLPTLGPGAFGPGGGGAVQLSPEDEVAVVPSTGMSKFILPALVVGGLLLFSKRRR